MTIGFIPSAKLRRNGRETMLKLYLSKNESVREKLKILISRHIYADFEIKTTENGKPYIEGNPLYFSLSHSRNIATIALSDKPVGVDLEYLSDRNFGRVLARFTERERLWIDDNPKSFFINWTAKEAYIKMTGDTLAHSLKRLEYCDGTLFTDGKAAQCGYGTIIKNNCVITVCADGLNKENIGATKIKRLRIKKGEKL